MKFKVLEKHIRRNSASIRNQNERLATNVVEAKPVSVFDLSFEKTTTFNSGKCVPVFCREVMPGDYWRIDTNAILRMSSPQAATMEAPNWNIDFFYVPNRLVWDKFKALMGESKTAGFQKEVKNIPLIDFDVTLKYDQDDLASYLGIPQNVDMSKIGVPISALFFKAFIQIYNDYYRDENLQDEIDNTNNNKNDDNVKVSDYITKDRNVKETMNESLQIGKGLPNACKLPDYFTTCLPWPQKGDAVGINNIPLNALKIQNTSPGKTLELFSPHWYNADGGEPSEAKLWANNGKTIEYGISGSTDPVSGPTTNPRRPVKFEFQNYNPKYLSLEVVAKEGQVPYNVNDFRLAVALQHMYELDARGGTRYEEILLNHFGISIDPITIDKAEYIAGFSGMVGIDNVVQTSASTKDSPLGNLGGVSVTSVAGNHLEYACKEHGVIIGILTVRPNIKYSQGLPKMFTKVERFDFFDTIFANIGEQPIKKFELMLSENAVTNNQTFGYNEAWADLRYSQNELSGYMSVNNDLSLAPLFAYTEKYAEAPVLSNEWIRNGKELIGDTLTLGGTSGTELEYIHQFLGNFYFKCVVDRRMPVYSIPGLKRI